MVRFYDPKDEADQARVEALLHKGGIEYFVTAPPPGSGLAMEIQVAEEDVPKAEKILMEQAEKR